MSKSGSTMATGPSSIFHYGFSPHMRESINHCMSTNSVHSDFNRSTWSRWGPVDYACYFSFINQLHRLVLSGGPLKSIDQWLLFSVKCHSGNSSPRMWPFSLSFSIACVRYHVQFFLITIRPLILRIYALAQATIVSAVYVRIKHCPFTIVIPFIDSLQSRCRMQTQIHLESPRRWSCQLWLLRCHPSIMVQRSTVMAGTWVLHPRARLDPRAVKEDNSS